MKVLLHDFGGLKEKLQIVENGKRRRRWCLRRLGLMVCGSWRVLCAALCGSVGGVLLGGAFIRRRRFLGLGKRKPPFVGGFLGLVIL